MAVGCRRRGPGAAARFCAAGVVYGNLGAGQWWSVLAAVAIGIPLYTNVTGIIPIMESLLLAGPPLGTTLAFWRAPAVSLPEVLMLKQVMR